MRKMNEISLASPIDTVEESKFESISPDVADFHSSLSYCVWDLVSSSLGCWKFRRLG